MGIKQFSDAVYKTLTRIPIVFTLQVVTILLAVYITDIPYIIAALVLILALMIIVIGIHFDIAPKDNNTQDKNHLMNEDEMSDNVTNESNDESN